MCAKNGFEYLEKNIFFEHVNTNIVYPKACLTMGSVRASFIQKVLTSQHAYA